MVANPTPPSKPEFPVEQEDKVEIENINQLLSSGAFVAKMPRKALRHPLVVAARQVLRQGFVSKQILQAPWNESCLDIRVSKASLNRALAIMAAVTAVLECHGVRVRVMPGDRSYGARSFETSAAIFGEKVQFGVTERTRQVRVAVPGASPNATGRQPSVTHYEATGELSLHVFSNSRYFTTVWRDSDKAKIESLVPECIASMMKIAVEYRRNTAKRNQEELFRKLRWEELKRLKTQIEAEEARIQRLETGADNWHRAGESANTYWLWSNARRTGGKSLALKQLWAAG